MERWSCGSKHEKTNSIKSIVFNNYIKTIFSVVSILLVLTLVFTAHNQVNQMIASQEYIVNSSVSFVESSVDVMSTVSLNILYSSTIENELRSSMTDRNGYLNRELVIKTIASIIGPMRSVAQVNIFTDDDLVIGWGVHELYRYGSYISEEQLEYIREKNGAMFFTPAQLRPDLVYFNSFYRQTRFISMYRTYFGHLNEELGTVEVIQNAEVFFAELNNVIAQNQGLGIYVFDADKQLIYPYYNEELVSRLEKVINEISPSSERVSTNLFDYEKIISYRQLENTEWVLLVEQDRWTIFAPLLWILLLFFSITLIFIGVIVLVTHKISDKLLKPVFHLMNRMERSELSEFIDQEVAPEIVEYDVLEIEMFSKAFNKMNEKLEFSAQELLNSKTEEIRAKMMATQSMVNPHFIYNNLSNITVMAEEKMNEEIISLCKDLSDYFRYISADSLINVPLSQEIFYTEKYLNCMKVRYGSRMTFSFDFPKELLEVDISKLSLQPIVENSLKYGFQNQPPWKLMITGREEKRFWIISIIDNGVGIDSEYIQEIMENLDCVKKEKDISKMQIGGLGLANVYLRLILLHGEKVALSFSTPISGGCEVQIKIPRKV